MAPQSMSVAEESRQTGVTPQTLYNWRKRARGEGVAMVADAKNPAVQERDVDSAAVTREAREACACPGLSCATPAPIRQRDDGSSAGRASRG
jgi:transposase-like protein